LSYCIGIIAAAVVLFEMLLLLLLMRLLPLVTYSYTVQQSTSIVPPSTNYSVRY
jgi:hypothetical protein